MYERILLEMMLYLLVFLAKNCKFHILLERMQISLLILSKLINLYSR